jgi:two-component system, LytTR family, response regulator
MKLRTLIADDEPLARERLRFLLSHDEDIQIVSECRNGREVLAAVKDMQID